MGIYILKLLKSDKIVAINHNLIGQGQWERSLGIIKFCNILGTSYTI